MRDGSSYLKSLILKETHGRNFISLIAKIAALEGHECILINKVVYTFLFIVLL